MTAATLMSPARAMQRRSDSHFARASRRLLRDRAAIGGAVILAVIVLLVLLAPVVAGHDPLETQPSKRLTPPLTGGYLLGADELGRDIFSRLLWGGRTSLMIAIGPVIISVGVGGLLGLAAGYFGRWVDVLIMRLMDILLAFPSILLAVGIAAALGPGLGNLMIALVVVGIPSVARIVRSSVLQIRELEYVQAARTLGASDWRIVLGHVLPNVMTPVIVFATLETGRKIILASGLNFLGLGVQPPLPDWGAMLATGRQVMVTAPHVATVPGMVIVVVTLAINILGDGLRDALDPRLRDV